MEFHLIAVGGRTELELGMAGQHDGLYQRLQAPQGKYACIAKPASLRDVFSYEGKYWTFPPKDLVQPYSAFSNSVKASDRTAA
jgi:hypothetical protein